MVSDTSKKKAAQKKAAAAAKRGGKAAAAAASSKTTSSEKLADGIRDIQISDRTCTGVLCSHPLSRDIRVRTMLLLQLSSCTILSWNKETAFLNI